LLQSRAPRSFSSFSSSFWPAFALAQQGRGRKFVIRAALRNFRRSPAFLAAAFSGVAIEDEDRRLVGRLLCLFLVVFFGFGPALENVLSSAIRIVLGGSFKTSGFSNRLRVEQVLPERRDSSTRRRMRRCSRSSRQACQRAWPSAESAIFLFRHRMPGQRTDMDRWKVENSGFLQKAQARWHAWREEREQRRMRRRVEGVPPLGKKNLFHRNRLEKPKS